MTISIRPSRASGSSFAALSGAARNLARRCTHHLLRHLGERQRPIDRRVAAAGDDHALAAEILAALHQIEDALALEGLDARQRRPVGTEGADPGGDDHRARLDDGAERGLEAEAASRQRRQPLDLLPRW